ncbi:hypothetical protein [Sphingobium herbicidovorans]|uniref:hypothetical protein n=1 Tax=Sphingobium herbicidovorans TaxID=76947 RepID=UPI001E5991F1|nr:hypothetical protein [Sphingobium herbicidovorans]
MEKRARILPSKKRKLTSQKSRSPHDSGPTAAGLIYAGSGSAKALMFIHNMPITANPRKTSMAAMRDEQAVMWWLFP